MEEKSWERAEEARSRPSEKGPQRLASPTKWPLEARQARRLRAAGKRAGKGCVLGCLGSGSPESHTEMGVGVDVLGVHRNGDGRGGDGTLPLPIGL